MRRDSGEFARTQMADDCETMISYMPEENPDLQIRRGAEEIRIVEQRLQF
jgi:hypothetical protein